MSNPLKNTRSYAIQQNLYNLYDEYMTRKNEVIEKANKDIQMRNDKIIHDWKNKIQRPAKAPTLDPLPKYTQE